MSFCPKYINIRRGQLLAAFIGSWGFVPVRRSGCLQTYHSPPLTIATVENPCLSREVPRFPRRLYHFPGSHDIHPDD